MTVFAPPSTFLNTSCWTYMTIFRGVPGNRTRLYRGKNSLRHLDANTPLDRGTHRTRTGPVWSKNPTHPWVLTSLAFLLWSLFHLLLRAVVRNRTA